MSENIEPGTREEGYLDAINRQLDGESVDTSALIEPGDRKETYLREIAQKIGSGGGSDLPPVTAADNGKALRVVSGDWAAADDEFVVTFTKSGQTWRSDYFEGDIQDAISAKKRVYGKVYGGSVTNDNYVKNYTLIVPLRGQDIINGLVFSGSYQSNYNTVFCTFVVYGLAVNAYTKTVSLSSLPYVNGSIDDYKVLTAFQGNWVSGIACQTIEYTVTGLPVDGVYPLSTDFHLEDIQTMLSQSANVRATITLDGNTAILNPASTGADFVTFSAVIKWSDAWVIFCVEHSGDGMEEFCRGYIIPLAVSE